MGLNLLSLSNELLLLIAESLNEKSDLLSLILTNRHLATLYTQSSRHWRFLAANYCAKTAIHALVLAVITQNKPMLRFLLSEGPPMKLKVDSESAIHEVPGKVSDEMFEQILEKGVNMTIARKKGWSSGGGSALHWMASMGKENTIKLLLEKGADPMARDHGGRTALHFVVLNSGGRPSVLPVINLLLDAGANFLEDWSRAGLSSLGVAYSHRADVVEKFLLKRAPVGYQSPDHRFVSPIDLAVAHHDVDFVQYMLEKGWDVNSRHFNGTTLLHTAARVGKWRMAKLLLDSGVDVNALDDYSSTALHSAIYTLRRPGDPLKRTKDIITVIKLLLAAGIDVNAFDGGHATALHMVAWNSTRSLAEAVTLLIKGGADPNLLDNKGRTALEVSMCCLNLAVKKELWGVTSAAPVEIIGGRRSARVKAQQS